jgi:hypothetical protein
MIMVKRAIWMLSASLLCGSAPWASAQERQSPTDAAPTAVAVSREAPQTRVGKEYVPPEGYQKRLRKGKEVYCRQVVPAGTRIKRSECFTRMELEAIEQAQRAFREDLGNQGLICADSRCSGGS